MFGIGLNELLIVLVIAVIIIGPKQLPEMAKTMGKLFIQFKRATNDLRGAVNQEIAMQDELNELKEIKTSLQSEISDIDSISRTYIEEELEEEMKIKGELESEIEAAASAIEEPETEEEEEISIQNQLAPGMKVSNTEPPPDEISEEGNETEEENKGDDEPGETSASEDSRKGGVA